MADPVVPVVVTGKKKDQLVPGDIKFLLLFFIFLFGGILMWNRPNIHNKSGFIVKSEKIDSAKACSGGHVLELICEIDHSGPVWQTYKINFCFYFKDGVFAQLCFNGASISPYMTIPKHLYSSYEKLYISFDGALSDYTPPEFFDYTESVGSTWTIQIKEAIKRMLTDRMLTEYIDWDPFYTNQSFGKYIDDSILDWFTYGAVGANNLVNIKWDTFYKAMAKLPTITFNIESRKSSNYQNNQDTPYIDKFGAGAEGTPEWYQGAFPDTPNMHMTFFDGRSAYVPNGMTIDVSLSKSTKEAGFIVIRNPLDLARLGCALLPLQSVVAYGKWADYSEPNFELLNQILKRQAWSLPLQQLASVDNLRSIFIDTKEKAERIGSKMGAFSDMLAITKVLTG